MSQRDVSSKLEKEIAKTEIEMAEAVFKLDQFDFSAHVIALRPYATRLATATELLRELEWEGDGMGARCPECRVAFRTHAPDCKLAAFLEGCK